MRTPPTSPDGTDAGGVAMGVCRGGTIHVAITSVAAVVVCTTVKKTRIVPLSPSLRLFLLCLLLKWKTDTAHGEGARWMACSLILSFRRIDHRIFYSPLSCRGIVGFHQGSLSDVPISP